MEKRSWLLLKWVCLLIPPVCIIYAAGRSPVVWGAAILAAVVLDGLLVHAVSVSLNRAAPKGMRSRSVLLYVIVYLGLGGMWLDGFWRPYYFVPYLVCFLLAGAYILRRHLVKRPISKRWLLLLPTVLALSALMLGFRYLNPKIVLYTEMMTYTMSDDRQTYLYRSPFVYVEPFLPCQALFIVRSDVRAFASQLADDSTRHLYDLRRRYNTYFDLDYTLQTTGDQLVITYFGMGKLRDGTVERIDWTDTYPLVRFEDRTAGIWDPPPLPWEIRLPNELQDPTRVIDPPPWPTEAPPD